jgi:preprotein translocase subunit SecY
MDQCLFAVAAPAVSTASLEDGTLFTLALFPCVEAQYQKRVMSMYGVYVEVVENTSNGRRWMGKGARLFAFLAKLGITEIAIAIAVARW